MRNKGSRAVHDLLLDGRIIDRAMRKAVKEALLRHKRAGVPIAVWRSGEVVLVKPTQIKISPDGARRRHAARSSRSSNISRASG